jgi:two-component system, chemotaxis family, CheB/CheR fusion protein
MSSGAADICEDHFDITSEGTDEEMTVKKEKKTAGVKRTAVRVAKNQDSAPSLEESPTGGFPVVGIGASAGGLAAFEAFFSGMPSDADPGMAFVLVQHLAPNHKSILTDLIRRYTRMKVSEVEDGMKVQPNCAYIIPPGRDMAFLGGALQLFEPSAPRGQRLPIDFFFRSLAQDQHERAIAIVLSGTGSDGTLGVRAIKGEGGMVMAQEPSTTEYDGMPLSAIATGLVDYELAPADMPARLMAYVSRAFGRDGVPIAREVKAENALKKVFVIVRAQTGHDFSRYKPSTIRRRVQRRMAVHQIETVESYSHYLQHNPSEVDSLFRDLLIGVTSFFRDPEAFESLEEKVIPKLFADKAADSPIRVWSPGCATGEEAYSLAILLAEQQEKIKRNFKIQIFATDIDAQAIAQARTGLYPASISADVTPERLARYFSPEPDGAFFRIHKSIRDMVVFSEQDVIKDPPFSRLDLISCRNLLIYVDTDLQNKLIPLFHYALGPGGVLFLGTSETVSEHTDLFTSLDRKMKIYQRRGDLRGAQRIALGRFLTLPAPEGISAAARVKPSTVGRVPLREIVEQALLSEGVPAAALVTANGDILYLHGRTGVFLEPASGESGVNNIVKMAREGLRRDLTTALHQSATGRQVVIRPNLQVKTNGDFTTVNLTVRPVLTGLSSFDAPLHLVVLERTIPDESGAPDHAPPGAPVTDADARIAALHQELRAKEEHLQTTMEELETANEELKSSNEEMQSVNEEMQSVNEELQSTNEELETSKEELESVNEELATVNAELQTKVADLTRANNDMNNLLAGTGIATVFVDHALRILRFTPAATRIINLIQGDIGRPVGHLVSNLAGYDCLSNDAREVLETLVPKEVEVETKSGVWYVMRIIPYRTIDNVIEGVVITFVDVDAQKKAQNVLARGEVFCRAFVTASSDAVYRITADWTEMSLLAGHSLVPDTGIPTATWLEKYVHHDDRRMVKAAIDESVRTLSVLQREYRGPGRDGSAEWNFIRVVPLLDDGGQIVEWVGFASDITDRKNTEEELAADLRAMELQADIGAAFLHEYDLDQVLMKIIDSAVVLARADKAAIQLLAPTGRLEIAGEQGFSAAWLDYWATAGDGKGVYGTALTRGERVIVEDVTAGPVFADSPALYAMKSAGIRAVVSTPLIARSGAPLGMLSVHFGVPCRPGEPVLRGLDVLARLAADAIERTRSPEKPDTHAEKCSTPGAGAPVDSSSEEAI